MTPLIVIPAAGSSTRMRGRDKLLEDVGGEPLLRRQARQAVATGCPVLVCLPGESAFRQQALAGMDVDVLVVPDADEGMGATLRAAARHVLQTRDLPMAVLLPDVPGVDTGDIVTVLTAFEEDPASAIRAADPDGRPGTPLFVPARLIPEFAGLRGDDGGKSVLKGEAVRLVTFPDDRATRDLDTPEDWASWRERT